MLTKEEILEGIRTEHALLQELNTKLDALQKDVTKLRKEINARKDALIANYHHALFTNKEPDV